MWKRETTFFLYTYLLRNRRYIMLIVEHQLKELVSCQAITALIAGPAPATHLFMCAGHIVVNAGHIIHQDGFINQWPDASVSFLLPDNDRQFLALTSSESIPLTILSSVASATFPMIEIGSGTSTSPTRREIKGVQVRQQESHAVLVINLWVNANVDLALAYQVSMLAGPVGR
jgi:hypothetical protein